MSSKTCSYCAGVGTYKSGEVCYWCEGTGESNKNLKGFSSKAVVGIYLEELDWEYQQINNSIKRIFSSNPETPDLTHNRLKDMIEARKLVLETLLLLKKETSGA